ncbi:Ctr domain-containing protein [Rhizoctonia solani AG-1 IA]|uniref:Ctr domain-containing protein n=1 Tax=Thanatephorus cucumeris (strain AG1-IA) TaxID=983506 RepID=L8WJU6_THACA|nr:Ctr domain-containing protein [Rhizoctonia solani AG-1 IA]
MGYDNAGMGPINRGYFCRYLSRDLIRLMCSATNDHVESDGLTTHIPRHLTGALSGGELRATSRYKSDNSGDRAGMTRSPHIRTIWGIVVKSMAHIATHHHSEKRVAVYADYGARNHECLPMKYSDIPLRPILIGLVGLDERVQRGIVDSKQRYKYVVVLVGLAAATPTPVEEKRLDCYNSCMQTCSPPGAAICSILCGQQCKPHIRIRRISYFRDIRIRKLKPVSLGAKTPVDGSLESSLPSPFYLLVGDSFMVCSRLHVYSKISNAQIRPSVLPSNMQRATRTTGVMMTRNALIYAPYGKSPSAPQLIESIVILRESMSCSVPTSLLALLGLRRGVERFIVEDGLKYIKQSNIASIATGISGMQSCSPPGSGTSDKDKDNIRAKGKSNRINIREKSLESKQATPIRTGAFLTTKSAERCHVTASNHSHNNRHILGLKTAHRWQILELLRIMDHSMHHMEMDHGGHGGHGGHGDMDMGPKCDMNMLWNTTNHISSNGTFFISFVAIVLLGVAYEWLRRAQTTLDVRIARSIAKGKTSAIRAESPAEDEPLNPRVFKQPMVATLSPGARISRAALYGAQLVFMTYNAYLILAVVLGAAIGHYVFGAQMDAEAVLSNAGVGAKGMKIAANSGVDFPFNPRRFWSRSRIFRFRSLGSTWLDPGASPITEQAPNHEPKRWPFRHDAQTDV